MQQECLSNNDYDKTSSAFDPAPHHASRCRLRGHAPRCLRRASRRRTGGRTTRRADRAHHRATRSAARAVQRNFRKDTPGVSPSSGRSKPTRWAAASCTCGWRCRSRIRPARPSNRCLVNGTVLELGEAGPQRRSRRPSQARPTRFRCRGSRTTTSASTTTSSRGSARRAPAHRAVDQAKTRAARARLSAGTRRRPAPAGFAAR